MRRLLVGLGCLWACSGPPAPDAALCRDVATRLCHAPTCAVVATRFSPTEPCAETLAARAGCTGDDFTFTTPSRNRFLECRLPLVRNGSSMTVNPGCDNVSEVLDACPDLVRFYGGVP